MNKILVTVCIALAPCLAQADVTLFSDNFNSDTVSANTVPSGWTVSNGTVDVVGPNWFGFLCAPGGVNCVDLDGSTAQAGTLSTSLTLTAGTTYNAYYDLAGNQRNYPDDIVDIGFGSATQTLTMTATDPWATHEISFTPTVTGSYDLSFHNHGGDNVGAVLDNVSVQTVPEPESYALLLSGIAFAGFVARRRKA